MELINSSCHTQGFRFLPISIPLITKTLKHKASINHKDHRGNNCLYVKICLVKIRQGMSLLIEPNNIHGSKCSLFMSFMKSKLDRVEFVDYELLCLHYRVYLRREGNDKLPSDLNVFIYEIWSNYCSSGCSIDHTE